MSSKEYVDSRSSNSKILFKSAFLAILAEAVLVTAIGWHEHWLAHPHKTSGLEESLFIEADVFQVPPEARLVEEKKTSDPAKPETTLSKIPGKGREGPKDNIEESNKTESGPKIAANHGAVAVYSPPPVIPSYLHDQDLKTNVKIDFFVNNQGVTTPRLVGSSGNEELDAIAIAAVKKWIFRPAEQDGKPIDSKVRLTITFLIE